MILKCLYKLPTQIGLGLIACYRYFVSPVLGNHCRFYPSCSSYARAALSHFGLLFGSWLALRRLLRCHPWHEGGYDPVPLSEGDKTTQSNLRDVSCFSPAETSKPETLYE